MKTKMLVNFGVLLLTISALAGCGEVQTFAATEEAADKELVNEFQGELVSSLNEIKEAQESNQKEILEALKKQEEVSRHIQESVAKLEANFAELGEFKEESVSSNSDSSEVEKDGEEVAPSNNSLPEGLSITYWYGVPCTVCEEMRELIDSLEKRGVSVTKKKAFDNGDEYENPEAKQDHINSVPQLWIYKDSKLIKILTGKHSLEKIEETLKESPVSFNSQRTEPSLQKTSHSTTTIKRSKSKEVQPKTRYRARWNWRGVASDSVSEDEMRAHLLSSHNIDATNMTREMMERLHDEDHEKTVSVAKTVSVSRNTYSSFVPRFNSFYTYQPLTTRRYSFSRCRGGRCW